MKTMFKITFTVFALIALIGTAFFTVYDKFFYAIFTITYLLLYLFITLDTYTKQYIEEEEAKDEEAKDEDKDTNTD